MIFNLFKAKPTLKDLIPNGFVDIHSHILPGIDDGAKNINESLKIILEMKKLGFSKIIGTPHTYPGLYENDNSSIKNSYHKVHERLNTEIKIDYASEYMLDNSIVEKARNKTLLCLKDNLVLVEMSFISEPLKLQEMIFEIQVNGYIPILAHPERYLFMSNNFLRFEKLKKVGCLFQANLLSFTGYYGKEVVKLLDKLVKRKMINYVGSDIHSQIHISAFSKKIVTKDVNALERLMKNNEEFK